MFDVRIGADKVRPETCSSPTTLSGTRFGVSSLDHFIGRTHGAVGERIPCPYDEVSAKAFGLRG